MFNQQFKHILFELNSRFILQKYRDLGVSEKSHSNTFFSPLGNITVPLTSITLCHRPI